MLKISKFVTGMLETNVYFCFDDMTRDCVIIDPADNGDKIINIVEKELNLKPVAILLTHAHFDHIKAAGEVSGYFGIKIYVNEKDAEMMTDPESNLSENFTYTRVSYDRQDFETFSEDENFNYLDRKWKVIETPGHTKGSVCFYIEDGLSYIPKDSAEEKTVPVLFSGDTLFQGSHGRTDFPGGSLSEIGSSIREKLLTLPSETSVFPGHGPQTSIGLEKKYNPFARY